MIQSDSENLELVDTRASVDAINAQFYGRFPYPWTPMTFSYLADDTFEATMLNQDLGDYQRRTVPQHPRIWVAGCGTNQAIFTALRFRGSAILGSDLSANSIELSRSTAHNLNIADLELIRESINEVSYENRFDYVICTGVIHHNADPRSALARLAAALKPHGVLELMVYNRHHRTWTTAFQKALRVMNPAVSGADFETDLRIAKDLISGVSEASPLATWLNAFKDTPEPALADGLMQPVEYSYTVQSLNELAESCGLELVLPCINQYDKAEGRISWNMRFGSRELQSRYDSLPDAQRWQVTNLLMLHKSPLLWFYMRRRQDGGRTTEAQACEAFLSTTFSSNRVMRHTYRRVRERHYELTQRAVPHPPAPDDKVIGEVIALADGKTPMSDILARLRVASDFQSVNSIRIRCTTSAFPYLKAVA